MTALLTRRAVLLLLLLTPVLFSFGCATLPVGKIQWEDPQVDLAWPPPPEKARIKYLRSLSGSGDFQKDGKSRRVLNWIAGEQAEGVPMVAPYGVCADGEGRVWVTDTSSRLVHVFDLGRQKVEFLNEVSGQALQSPVGIAVDRARNRLYLSDSILEKVFVLDLEGQLLGELRPPGGFARPAGVAVDGEGQIFVADVLAGQVEHFSSEGLHLGRFGSGLNANGRFNRPSNIAVDRSGRLYVVDSMNFRVEVIDQAGSYSGSIGQIGDVPGSFSRPRGVAVDSAGHIYVSDAAFDNVQIFDLSGRLLFYFGSRGKGPGRFSLPAGLFIDQHDRIYVVDAFNNRLQVFEYLGDSGDTKP